MATKRLNARDLIFEVSDMAVTPVWTQVAGITEASVDPSANEETTDTVDFDSDGQYAQEIMQRGAKLTVKGRKLVDSTTGAVEPGQAQLDTHAAAVADASVVNVRFRYPLATTWTVWAATVSRGEEGGGTSDKVGFSYEITRCGAATTAPAP